MKIIAIHNGKNEDKWLIQAIEIYEKRLKHYINFETIILPQIKNTNEKEQKQREAKNILDKLNSDDFVVLLDENGNQMGSEAFSDFLQKRMNAGLKRLVFITGGPYGFDESVYQRANAKVSLSLMTFSHQMVRLFFVEQVYRAFTILKGEPYHHK